MHPPYNMEHGHGQGVHLKKRFMKDSLIFSALSMPASFLFSFRFMLCCKYTYLCSAGNDHEYMQVYLVLVWFSMKTYIQVLLFSGTTSTITN